MSYLVSPGPPCSSLPLAPCGPLPPSQQLLALLHQLVVLAGNLAQLMPPHELSVTLGQVWEGDH
jgi:hypothetical protein